MATFNEVDPWRAVLVPHIININKIIFPSSGCSVYGNNHFANELSPLEPSSSYGIIKLAIENIFKVKVKKVNTLTTKSS